MKSLIVVNAYVQNKSQISQAERVAEELQNLGVEAEIRKNFHLSGISGGIVPSADYAFCVFLDKDRVAARLLEKGGLRLYNTSRAIEVCDDKMLTNIALAGSGISLPDCVYAPLCYNDCAPDVNFLDKTAQRLGFPLVAKTNYGSLGAGVTLINNEKELYSYEERNMKTPHFYQRFIDCGGGEDVRVLIVGGKYLCAMKRRNGRDFRSNIELGGKGEKYQADEELIALCEKAATLLELDYCGVDVLTDKAGKRYLCEVNSNAFFAAAERVCGVNVAAAYARYIVKDVQKDKN